jgi:hypothetical protein
MADVATGLTLRQIAAGRFDDISPAEQKLFDAAGNGKHADCTSLSEEDRTIRGELLSWLCTDPQATAQITYRGISVVGAEVVKKVDLKWAKISFPITASRCVFEGEIDLRYGHFASLELFHSSVQELVAFGTHFEGNLFLGNDFKAKGKVNLLGAKIDGTFSCVGGEFTSNGETPALNASDVEVKGGLFLRRGFKAEGGVNLVRAKIDGDLDCVGGEFTSNGETPALNASGVEVKGSVYLNADLDRGFKAEGGVNLVGAKIGGDLACAGGELIGNDKAPALNANSAKIDGAVVFREGFAAEGTVSFVAAYATRGFQWTDAEWTDAESKDKAFLDLRYFKAGILLNSENSWPNQDRLRLDGFVYDQFDDRALPNATVQLGWLHRQPRGKFLSQPYEQLAAVLGRMGLEEDQRKVLIAKNEDHREHLPAPMGRQRFWDWISFVFEWCWYKGLGRIIGYGYHPWNAFVISLVVIGIGWSAFSVGYHSKLIAPTGDKAYVVEKDGTRRFKKDGKTPQVSPDYPKFNAFVYSLETFLPLVKFGIGERWAPNANLGTAGSVLRYYLWIHITAGWVLTTLWIGGLTRLLKT